MSAGKIGKYERLDVLGSGTSGVVYLAWDTLLRRQVALKEIRADGPETERLLEEARVLDRLQHPHIVRIHSVDVTADNVVLLDMELVSGRNLASVLKERAGKPMPASEAARIALSVLDALGYAHERRIIHRDIKPANILIGNDGMVKLTDFGLAEALGTGSVAGGGGTYPYMAPEDFADDAASDRRSDLWAVGVLLYEMLTGRRPFSVTRIRDPFAWKRAVEQDVPPPPSSVNPVLAPQWDAVLLRALARDKNERFGAAQEFAAAIQSVSGAGVAAPLPHAQNTQASGAAATFVFSSTGEQVYTLDELLAASARNWDESRRALADGRVEAFLRTVGEVWIADLAGGLRARAERGESPDRLLQEFLERARGDETVAAPKPPGDKRDLRGTVAASLGHALQTPVVAAPEASGSPDTPVAKPAVRWWYVPAFLITLAPPIAASLTTLKSNPQSSTDSTVLLLLAMGSTALATATGRYRVALHGRGSRTGAGGRDGYTAYRDDFLRRPGCATGFASGDRSPFVATLAWRAIHARGGRRGSFHGGFTERLTARLPHIKETKNMTPRKYIGWGLLGLFVLGVGNFAVGNLQTRGSLGKVAVGGTQADTGVRELMARNVLFDALQGGAAPKTRLYAVASLTQAAQDGKHPDAFKQLLQMLKDPDTETIQQKTHPVRDAVTAAVASVGTLYPDLLLDAAKDPDGAIRDQSRSALKTIGVKMQTQMAARLGDAALRSPLGDILSGIGASTVGLVAPYLSPAELDKLKDKPDDLTAAKLQLIEIMGKYKVTEAANAVLPFEKDPEPNVRRGVITALANIADPVGEPVLRAALVDPETDASSRAAAAATLGAFGTAQANDAMVTALSDFDLAVADAAAAGLTRAAGTNEVTARIAIARALQSPDAAVRARAVSATAGMTATDIAAKAITDPDASVRATAASALGTILSKRNAAPLPIAEIAPLVTALRDSDGSVADAAQRSLVTLGASSVPAVAALLSDPQETTAYYAVRTLSAIGAPSLPTLLQTAQSGHPGARWAAVTLGEIGDVSARSVLETLKTTPDTATANAASDALAKIGG